MIKRKGGNFWSNFIDIDLSLSDFKARNKNIFHKIVRYCLISMILMISYFILKDACSSFQFECSEYYLFHMNQYKYKYI